MAARFAPDDWPRRAEVVGAAEELRARAEPLADADAEAYAAFKASPGEPNRERNVVIPYELTVSRGTRSIASTGPFTSLKTSIICFIAGGSASMTSSARMTANGSSPTRFFVTSTA